MMIRAGDVSFNPACVAEMEWDRRFYVNGSESTLIITMQDGKQHRIKYQPHLLGVADPYEVERQVLAANNLSTEPVSI